MNNISDDKLNKKIEDLIRKNKDARSFLDSILFDVVSLECEKLLNLIIIIIGLLSPIVPLIFLFRKDLIDSMNLIAILIISILINAIILVMGIMLNGGIRQKKIRYLISKLEKKTLSLELKRKRNKSGINKFKLMLDKSVKINKHNNCQKYSNKKGLFLKIRFLYLELYAKYLEAKSKKITNSSNTINSQVENIKKKIDNKDQKEDLYFAVTVHLIMGIMIIAYKTTQYLGLLNIDFRYVLQGLLIMYIIIYGRCLIFEILNRYYNIISLIYREANKKREDICFEKYKQVSIFDNEMKEL